MTRLELSLFTHRRRRAGRLATWVLVSILAAWGGPPSAWAAADPDIWQRQVIYLVMPDRFYDGSPANDTLGAPTCYEPGNPKEFHGGDLAGLRQKLGYLRTLGVTAVWSTPVYKQVGSAGQDSCGYHGYWPDLVDPADGAMEPKLGTASELSALINALHASGMKFILDMVVNHAGYNARVVSQHPEWFHASDTCSTLGDPDVFCPLAGLPDFKQELEGGAVTAYLIHESKGWVSRFAIDGIRMDTAKHVPDWFFRDFWIPEINRARSGLFQVAEVFLEGSVSQLKPYVMDVGFDSAFNFPLRRALVEAFAKGGSVDLVASKVQEGLAVLGLDQALMLTNLLDNHDVPRFVNEPGFGVPEDEIRRRYHLSLVALFTLPGIPQLYYGDELAMYGGADPDNRRDMPAWAWTSSGRSGTYPGQALPTPQLTFSYVQKLIGLRKSNPALYRGYYAELWRHNGDPNPNVYAFFRGSGGNRVVVALNNGSLASGLLDVPVQGNGAISGTDRVALADGTVLVDLLGAGAPSPLTLTDGHFKVDLPGKVAGMYRPRSRAGASAVTFRVTTTTTFGESVYIAGGTPELGGWEPNQAVRMRPSNCSGTTCTWSVTLRYLPGGQSLTFKFLKTSSSGSVWEGGSNRTYAVPATSNATYQGSGWQN